MRTWKPVQVQDDEKDKDQEEEDTRLRRPRVSPHLRSFRPPISLIVSCRQGGHIQLISRSSVVE